MSDLEPSLIEPAVWDETEQAYRPAPPYTVAGDGWIVWGQGTVGTGKSRTEAIASWRRAVQEMRFNDDPGPRPGEGYRGEK